MNKRYLSFSPREAHLSGRVAALSPAGHFIARSTFTLLLLLCCGLVPGAAQNLTVCTGASFTIASIQDSDASATYQWTINGADIPGATGVSYTDADGIATGGVYLFVRKAYTEECGLQVSNGFMVMVKSFTVPGATVTFEAFDPNPDAAVGTVWNLTDTRAGGNNNTYKVKKMQDGRIWMVQDLKFGNRCGTDFTGSKADQTGKVSSSGTYYGDCTTSASTATPAARGYMYDWAAAINKAGAYYESATDVGCKGTGSAANACQGICPAGWHIPTGNSDGEFYALHNAPGRNCATNNDDCWDADSDWEGVAGGRCIDGSLDNQGSSAYYWSSTYRSGRNAYVLAFSSSITHPGTNDTTKNPGYTVRCLRNY